MVRAIEYLQSLECAGELFAFTSLVHFQVTTAPNYHESESHPCVGITWRNRDRLFELSFGKIGTNREDHFKCTEKQFPSAIEALLLRLVKNEPSPD